MSYTPTEWKAGDTVTSTKLNKMEQGIVNSDIIEIIEMTQTEEELVIGKTAKEIANLMKSGKLVFLRMFQENDNTHFCLNLHMDSMRKFLNQQWVFGATSSDTDFPILEFVAETDNDYPAANLTSEE